MSPKELRARRLELGLSVADLAERLNLPSNTVSAWERGDAPLDATVALELMNAPLRSAAFCSVNHMEMPDAMERQQTILIVDRSEPIRVLLTAFFTRGGFSVDATPTIDRALSKLRGTEFDAVILDPSASNDGDAVSALARSHPDILGTTVVVASPPHRPVTYPVHAVIDKPFDLDRLLNSTVACLQSKHLRQP